MSISYALLPDRVKAAFIDSVILVAMMYGFSELFDLFENVPQSYRFTAFILVFLLYDPLLTSIYGGTIGHSYSNILVKNENEPSKNISFPIAVLRFVVKLFLGWLSLLTVTSNEKRKAIHDFVAKSIVIMEKSK
tara:strand:+ start:864 stop:1265 length:402 start_codon:yes stop_codon:yes gene_type:complete